MRIVQANAVYDPAATTPGALLDSYRTLTEWSTAVAAAGASTVVVQRFRNTTSLERDRVHYQFVADKQPPWLSTTAAPQDFIEAIAAQSPDVVHVNGLIFPQLVASIRKRLGGRVAIVVQHHGGEFPVRGSGLLGMWQRKAWRNGLASANAISFTAAAQADRWREAGMLAGQKIIEIVEASTTMRKVERERARLAVGVDGDPLILWVGRLTSNKDPLSVLDGLDQALPQLPSARVVMVFGDDTLRESVEQRVQASAVLRPAVVLTGRVAHDELPNYYGAADVFVSGSHDEGSGYALIEAMSAGVVPVVTDIPSFRVIAGDCGTRWTPGDAASFSSALLAACVRDRESARAAVAAHFARALSWRAIAEQTVNEYRALAASAGAR